MQQPRSLVAQQTPCPIDKRRSLRPRISEGLVPTYPLLHLLGTLLPNCPIVQRPPIFRPSSTGLFPSHAILSVYRPRLFARNARTLFIFRRPGIPPPLLSFVPSFPLGISTPIFLGLERRHCGASASLPAQTTSPRYAIHFHRSSPHTPRPLFHALQYLPTRLTHPNTTLRSIQTDVTSSSAQNPDYNYPRRHHRWKW